MNIRELLGDADRVWIWIGPDEALRARFLQDCMDAGLKIDGFVPGNAVALHRDGSLRHIMLMAWVESWSNDGYKDIPKIDYRQYLAGEDYLLKSCNIQKIV